MARIIHIGDIHLQSEHARAEDRVRSVCSIIDAALAGGPPTAWIIPGDIFHTRSTAADRNTFATLVQRMAAEAPVCIVAGNHDAPGDLDIFGALMGRYRITVATRPEVVTLHGADKTVAVLALPYAHKAGLVGAGVEHGQLPSVASNALESIILALGQELNAAIEGGALGVVALHQNIAGAISSVGQPQVGAEIEYPVALLDRLRGDVPILANHIHKHQVIERQGLPAIFAGSTSRHDFGEQEAKGFVVWSYDWFVHTWTWQFIEIDTPQQWQVTGRLSREAFVITEINGAPIVTDEHDEGLWPFGTAEEARALWVGADIRVRYEYDKAQISTIDTAKILAEFAGCRSLKLEGVPVAEAQVRAPEVAAAVTLEDKLAAVCKRQNIPWSTGLAEKLSALQSADAATVIAAWADTVTTPAESAVA